MKRNIFLLAALVCLVTSFSSCLKSDDTELVYYNDTAITSVVLGTMTRTVHTVSSKGADSTYTVKYSGSKYPMFIDQAKNLIYNVDSLPKDTKQNMLVTVSALNSSYVFLKSLTSDSIISVTNTDSIDFSQPRTLRVFSSDGVSSRDYNMEVRIHNDVENVFTWQQRKSADVFASLLDMRGMSAGEKVFVSGIRESGDHKVVYSTGINDGDNWQLASESLAKDADIVSDGECLYALSDGEILSSSDGATWSPLKNAAALKHLVAATGEKLYGISADGIVACDYNGNVWKVEALDDDAAYLPAEDINAVLVNQRTNSDLKKLLLIGRRNATEYSNDAAAVIWSHIEGIKAVEEQQPWMYQGYGRDGVYEAPALNHLTVVPYNGAMLLIGGDGTGSCHQAPLTSMLCSSDQGLTWKKSTIVKLPANLSSSSSSFTMIADKNDYLWIIAGTTGQVWRGTLSHLQWK